MNVSPETVFWIVLITAPLVSFMLRVFFGKDRPIVETVEFRPPEGLTPAEVGLLWDGKVDDRDITAMFLDWANKGIVIIEGFDKGDLLISRIGTLPDGARPFEEKLYRWLFIVRNTISVQIQTGELAAVISDTKKELLKEYGIGNIKSLFDLRSLEMRRFAFGLAFLPFIFYMVYIYDLKGPEIFEGGLTLLNICGVAVPGLMIAIHIIRISGHFVLQSLSGKPIAFAVIKAIIISPLFVISLIILIIANASFFDAPFQALLTILSVILCVLAAFIMPRRTFYYSRMLGLIRGFANFVRAAELDRLRLLLEENSSYAYNMLPYVWAMGLSDEWAEMLDRYRLAAAPPLWYKGQVVKTSFSFMRMTNSLNSGFGAE